jgi:antitoxin component of MazEF toxin-antitoxin module
METKRRLKKIGGSVALFIPPEMLEELGLEPGSEVEVVSEGSSIRVRSAESRPPDDLIEFAHRFTRKYEEALRNLSHR